MPFFLAEASRQNGEIGVTRLNLLITFWFNASLATLSNVGNFSPAKAGSIALS
jgi:hypothetical protein